MADCNCLWAPRGFLYEFQNGYLDVTFLVVPFLVEVHCYWFVWVTSFDVPEMACKPVS